MNGLEYILGLYNIQHIELAEKLGIKKTKHKHVDKRKTKYS
ncbi:hypothetical protein ANS017_03640 [Paraclostridium bifermentans]|nr:hypothetical protein ANS017_03640 [Paraclostridium bifermentans]